MVFVKLRRETKFFIIFIIFFISFYFSAKWSHIFSGFKTKQIRPNLEYALRIFDTAQNHKKIKIMITEGKEENNIDSISSIVSKYGEIKFSEKKPLYFTAVIQIPDSLYNDFIMQIRSIKIPREENVISTSNEKINIDIKEHLQNAILAKETVINALKSKRLTPERFKNYQNQLSTIQAEIDSLKNLNIISKLNTQYDLILLSTYKDISVNNLSSSLKKFLIALIVSMVILSVIGFILYFFVVLILFLMKKVGIKTATSSSGSYKYNYNKGYYGKSGIKRVKRIYKDKESSQREE